MYESEDMKIENCPKLEKFSLPSMMRYVLCVCAREPVCVAWMCVCIVCCVYVCVCVCVCSIEDFKVENCALLKTLSIEKAQIGTS